jgi:hypothetical protein
VQQVFGKKDLKPGEATIVETHVKHHGDDGRNTLYEWVADVTPTDGPPFRTVLQTPNLALDFKEPVVGDHVSVLINPKDGTARFDKSDPRISLKADHTGQDQRFTETLGGAVGTPAPANPSLHGGAPAPPEAFTGVQVMSASDAAPFLQSFLSEDPSARDQAIAELRAHQHPDASNVADRLSALENLRNTGALNDTEYEAQRQKIIGSI